VALSTRGVDLSTASASSASGQRQGKGRGGHERHRRPTEDGRKPAVAKVAHYPPIARDHHDDDEERRRRESLLVSPVS
jgi:hypothetical protein